MTNIPFMKMVGAGNDFVIVDARRRGLIYGAPRAEPVVPLRPPVGRNPERAHGQRLWCESKDRWPQVARALCDRHMGIGADGLLVLEPSRSAAARMRVFNPDGSEAEMCGNGARCVARYLAASPPARAAARRVAIETAAGRITASVRGERVAMRLTDPTELTLRRSLTVGGRRETLGFVNTGVPHAVVPVADLERVDVAQRGRLLRRHPAFAPRGANVNFIQPDRTRRARLRVRTYERGVEAETLACGTGIAASAVIYGLTNGQPTSNGRPAVHRMEVQARSGDVLGVSFTARATRRGAQVTGLVLDGPARVVFSGVAAWPLRAGT